MHRVLVAFVIAFVAFGVSEWLFLRRPPAVQGMDFTYPWLAGKALLLGVDPYAYVRAHPLPWTSTLFYPATAGVVAWPVVGLSPQIASSMFVGASFGLLAYHLSRDGWWRLTILLSASAYAVCWSSQWAPLLMAAALYAPLLGVLAGKPNFALPALAYQTTGRAIVYAVAGGAVILAISLLRAPTWPLHWLAALHGTPEMTQYQIPLLTKWGWIAGIAAFKWKRRDARLVLGLACVPQNFLFYDQFMLMLVASSFREALILGACSWVAFLATVLFPIAGPDPMSTSINYIPLVVGAFYLPALVMVLRRPNEATA